MKNKIIVFTCFVLSFSAFFTSSVSGQEQIKEEIAKSVKAIEVKGNKTISVATILSKIKTRVGQDYIQSVISDDLKRLYNTGYFSDVRVDREDYQGGLRVIIFLEEKAIVEEVTFSRTRYVKKKKIIQSIKTKSGKFLDKKSILDDVKTIRELYEQKGLTQAEVEVETFVDEITNKASVHFSIVEGYKIRVTDIHIFGNESFADKKIQKVMKTKKKSIFFFRSGYLKEDVLEEDVERIVSFYEQEGFIDARVSYEVDYLSDGKVNVDIQVDEGRRYFVGDVRIKGNRIASEYEILQAMEDIKTGSVFSRDKLGLDIANIRNLYFDRGYIFAEVIDATSLDPDSGEVLVKVDIREGDVAYINRVKIQGNTRTRDLVIRRELRMTPGDRFDGNKLRRSKERLANLGYFEDVGFDIEDSATYDKKNLVVQVKEAKTGTFSFGGGFSTVDRVVGFIEIQQRNFDLFNWPSFTGGGQNLMLRAEIGSSRNNYRLSFTEPWIFDRPISFGIDAYRTERDRDDNTGYAYDEKRTGGGIRFGKQFTEYFSMGTSYKMENVDISSFEGAVSAALAAEEGENTLSVFGINATHDRRDSVFSPTKGTVVEYGLDVAGGAFGGDKDFLRNFARASYYVPLVWKSVVEFKVRAGIVDAYGNSDSVPIFERFFAGGASTIRGYDERGVGPLDSGTEDPIGGESMLLANIEYTIPLIDYIKLAAFFDSGNVWSDVGDIGSSGIKSGTGLGLRIKTPIGPVKLDYGYPLNDEPGKEDRTGKFYFSVSRGF